MEKLFVGDGEVKVEGDVIDLETRLSVIQALIPLGLEAVADLLQQEVEQLAGVRYARKGSEQAHRRWGSQKGSVYLMDQKLPLDVPESVCRNEPRGRPGGNPDPPPAGYAPIPETKLPNHQLHRSPQQQDRRAHSEGQTLEQLSPETQMGGCRTPRHRTSPATRERIQTSSPTQASTEQRSESRQRTECSKESLTKLRGPMSFN